MVLPQHPTRLPRSTAGTLIACTVAVLAFAAPSSARQVAAQPARPVSHAQQVQPVAPGTGVGERGERLDAVDHAQRMANRAAVGGGLRSPELPPVFADSPRDDLMYADRFPSGQQEDGAADASLVTHIIPSGAGGTGTPLAEIMQYQLPDGYDDLGPPHPMVIAYHGYGASAQSVANQSTLDEECNTRNWIYMAPTGMDDQLFGTAYSQQNTEVAIQYMLDNFNVDPDRMYMIGFSMGAGVCANFISQRRDPDGMMFAGLGLLCGTYDWTQAYALGSASLKTFMQDPLHFGGTPMAMPFEYQRWSSLYFEQGTYPPVPGTLVTDESMAVNLGSTPVYVTWDTTDALVQVTKQNPRLLSLLSPLGGTVESKTVASTFDPDSGQFVPHSWLVLDEVDLCDFFDGKVVDRTPASFRALLDEDGPVSWMQVTQRQAGAFSALQATTVAAVPDDSDPILGTTGLDNCIELGIDLGATPIAGNEPIEVTANSIDGDGFKLLLSGAACPPVYMKDATLGTLVPGVDYDPNDEELTVSVTPGNALQADAVCEPDWTTKLWIAPKLLGVGDPLDLMIDAPPGTTIGWLLAGFGQQLATVKGYHITVSLAGSFLIPLPLGPQGDLSLLGKLPNDPGLSGLDLLLQVIGTDGSVQPVTASNMWIIPVL